MLASIRSLRSLVPLVAVVGSALPVAAQKLHLVDDVESKPTGLLMHEHLVVTHNGWSYFAREGAGVGAELHRVNVATGSLELVRDVHSGPDGSRPDLLTVLNGVLYFTADDGVHGVELWRSDGTAAGTQMVADIRAGSGGSIVVMPWVREPLAIAAGELFFAADSGGGATLWHSDGTTAGTQPVANGGPNPAQIASDGTAVYYRAQSELRRATAAGATALKSFYGGPNQPTVFNGAVYFHAALNGNDSYELWKSDGTAAGTVLVKDIHAGAGLGLSSYASLFTVAGNQLFFTANDGVHGRELWSTDGTSAGTALVADIGPGIASGLGDSIYWRMTAFGGRLFFAADAGSGATLWRSDGTAAGTQPVVSGPGAPALELLGALPQGDVAGPTLYFAASDGAHGSELWSTDGTAAGTAQVADLAPGSAASWPRAVEVDGAGGAAFLAGPATAAALWTSGGSGATTALAADRAVADLPMTGDSDPLGVFDMFDRVLVGLWQSALGRELWSGSAATGLDLLADLNPGEPSAFTSGDPEVLSGIAFGGLRLGNRVFFLADLGTQISLWVSDGTPAGTLKVRDLGSWSGIPTQLVGVALDDEIVFRARGDASNFAVWRSDGTFAGTSMVAWTGPGIAARFTRVGNAAIFTVDGFSDAVWRTDGTSLGTQLVYNSGSPLWLGGQWSATVGDHAYFPANAAGAGVELWRTDGTTAGTQLVADIRPGAAGSDPQRFTRCADELLFTADDGVTGRELWRSDGTAAGTALVANLAAGSSSSSPTELTAVGERLFFAFGASSTQLGVYAQGAAQVLHGFAGQGFGVSSIRAVGSRRVFFSGNDGVHGSEPWSSDGTVVGTQMYDDFQPGPSYSQPAEFVLSDGLLYVAVSSFTLGAELYYANVGATAQPLGTGCAATGNLPALSADDPVLGTSTVVRMTDAGAGLAGLVFVGAPALPWFLGSGCSIHVSPVGALPLAAVSTSAGGKWTSAPIAVPSDPSLAGAQLVLQAILGPSATQPLGFDLSNGVLLTLHAY